jgi:hypothetical protein
VVVCLGVFLACDEVCGLYLMLCSLLRMSLLVVWAVSSSLDLAGRKCCKFIWVSMCVSYSLFEIGSGIIESSALAMAC